ncbi:MAG: RidA family protein [Aminobacteriaceae bacterium]
MKKIISTANAPAAVGPYSQAIKAGPFLFCSGQLPMDPKTGEFVPGGVAEQAEQVLKNVQAVLEGAGYSLNDVVKATVFATSMGDFAAVNGVYAKFFEKEPPARSFVEVSALPRGAQVEIEVIAWKE